jgi:hypothetical protein
MFFDIFALGLAASAIPLENLTVGTVFALLSGPGAKRATFIK